VVHHEVTELEVSPLVHRVGRNEDAAFLAEALDDGFFLVARMAAVEGVGRVPLLIQRS